MWVIAGSSEVGASRTVAEGGAAAGSCLDCFGSSWLALWDAVMRRSRPVQETFNVRERFRRRCRAAPATVFFIKRPGLNLTVWLGDTRTGSRVLGF